MGHQVPFFLGFYRRQYFTHPLGEGGMAAHENRHIGPQLKAKSRQLIFRETAAPQMVERHQHGGSIGGATAQAAAHRQALIDTDIGAAARRQAIAFAGGMHQQTRGANDQILLVRHAGHRRQQAQLAVSTRFDGQRIAVIEKLKQRLQGMVTIGPLAGDI